MRLPLEDLVRLARVSRLRVRDVEAILAGAAPVFLRTEQVAHVHSLAAEAHRRLPASRRVRVLAEETTP